MYKTAGLDICYDSLKNIMKSIDSEKINNMAREDSCFHSNFEKYKSPLDYLNRKYGFSDSNFHINYMPLWIMLDS